MKKYLRMLRTVFTMWSLLTLVVGQAGLASLPVAQSFGQKAQAQELVIQSDQSDQSIVVDENKPATDEVAEPEAVTPPQQVIICHATSSASNPFERLQVNINAIDAHFDNPGTPKAGHESDILYYNLDAQCPGPVVTSVGGMKWEDLNGDSEHDNDEPGVAGVRIDITQQVLSDSALNTQLYASTTYTDDNGDYQFVDVPMYGSFRICETVPAGWHQTFPINENDNCHNYNTYASIAINSYDFGNQRDPQESVCGNQVKDDGEQCDDGNTVNGDGCSSTCQLETPQCTDQQSGWWSEYFNLPSNHPDVGAGDIPHFPYDDNTHGDPLGSWAPWTADWYDAQYYRFSRVDANLNFGDDFFPMDMIHEEVNPAWNNHDFFFAVHSRAKVTAPTTDDYSYMLRSDDDSWVYIDGVRFDDKDGIHPPATSGITEMPLTAGDHIIDVFYAERHPLGATLVMTLDDRLTVMPAPEHCNNLCGNQVKDRGEQCDDGNTVNGDGCNNKCQLETPECTDQQSGWWGEYYNYSINHPDMELDGTLWPDNGHGDPRSGSWNTDWYDDQYYRFSRVDSSLNYGDNYFPEDFLAEEISFGHEYHFGVHWRGKVTAPANDTYTYHLRTDDDSWVYVDNVLIDNEAGVHAPYTSPNTQMNLTAGDHIIDIYFAERHRLGSTMEFTLDERLPVTPAPEDCQQCTNPLDYNHDQAITLSDAVLFTTYYENHDIKADINGNGGVDYGDYLCSYTPIATALYQCPLVCAAVCGDHIVQQNLQEQCDDGNVNNGDGCNARCQTETNECEVPNPLDYNGDYELNASDAVTFTQYYSADDVKADVNNNDIVDYGDYLCAQPYYSGQLAYTCSLACADYTPVCGDTHKDAGEQCDDGNTANGDGCSSSCQIEHVCEGDNCGGGESYCGDGHVDEGEQCDDGNRNNNDSCSNECTSNEVPPVTPPTRTGGGGGGGGLSPQTNLTIAKIASTAFATPGSQVTYTITVKNTGNTVAANVNLNDTLPAGFTFVDGGGTTKTWHWDTIAVGETVSVSYGVNISGTEAVGVYPNVAVVTSPTGPVSAQAFVNVEVRQPQVLGVETEAPAPAPEKVRVLGFETLPNTSGDWNYLGMIAAFLVLSLGVVYGRKAFKA